MKKKIDKTDFLSELVLLRNNPELIYKLLPLASAGNAHAQYALGLVYAEGRGVKQDNIQAYIWLSRAVAQDDEDARLLRDMLLNQMTEAEVAVAQRKLTSQVLQ
ncbi:MAG: SEL1-like repeat protein [Thioalkalispiraceae bacterium]|jgi:TPR repeat protein